jgi:hypothetical protein
VRLAERAGPEVRPLVQRLSFIRDESTWGQHFRTSPLLMSEEDFQVLAGAVMQQHGRRAKPVIPSLVANLSTLRGLRLCCPYGGIQNTLHDLGQDLGLLVIIAIRNTSGDSLRRQQISTN